MIPSILARQLQQGMVDYFRTTFPFANEPFRSSFERFSTSGQGLYLEPYSVVRLPFRTAEQMPTCFEALHPQYLPYVHQQRAWERLVGDDGQSTVVATGTGSGKTECFLYPILEYCWRHRETRGVKALVIYPMNALATDQAGRIARLISGSPELKGNVSVGLYVGGLSRGGGSSVMGDDFVITDRATMQANPPDVLLTNYKMLDYLLVRPDDTHIWDCDGYAPLKYVAVDEIHTFDGAQGTDLACLLRRLKTRLRIPQGSLCCIGTSATMGDASTTDGIRGYASDVFGEPFDADSVITEDRLGVYEFLGDVEAVDDPVLDEGQCDMLRELAGENDGDGFLQAALDALCDSLVGRDAAEAQTRLLLSEELRRNTLFRDLLTLTEGSYFQTSKMVPELAKRHPWLDELSDPEVVVEALVALVSHARTGDAQHLRPFLSVQTQLWVRELARLLGEVRRTDTRFELAINLKEGERKHFLPLHNCRDCGQTAWVTLIDRNMDLKANSLDAFYNSYFGDGENIVALYPRKIGDQRPGDLMTAWVCPECLHVSLENEQGEREESHRCTNCDAECIPVFLSQPSSSSRAGSDSHNSRQYTCPYCGSTQGLSLMGLRTTTEAEVALSQMFASSFDDDSKSLAFSDNVQDASHRAGFFNGRTWRFGLRTAMATWLAAGGDGMTLADFAAGFPRHFRQTMGREEFVSRFLAPNNLWMREYENMVNSGALAKGKPGDDLIESASQRMRYEAILEFGMRRTIGRTLEKSCVATIAYEEDALEQAIATACELAANEQGRRVPEEDMGGLVVRFLDKLRSLGAIADLAFDQFVANGAKGYFLSHDYSTYLPGLHGSVTPQFLLRRGTAKGFVSVATPSLCRLVTRCLDPLLDPPAVLDMVTRACARAGLLVEMAPGTQFACYGLSEQKLVVTSAVTRLECGTCGAQLRVAETNLQHWLGGPCPNDACQGRVGRSDWQGHDYYGNLFSGGLSKRVRAREHTGLLERGDREELEQEFKAVGDKARPWYPNVLSCTPTLEMGIDIGDLSSLMLCDMPPGQAQFLQRVGRAGRRDGNAFCLVLADASPRGMYFYAAPEEMLQGNVEPPRVFLHAAAVLERQLVAFCMDSWIVQRGPKAVVPAKVRPCLSVVAAGNKDAGKFPFNFLDYVKLNKRALLNTFLNMFQKDLGNDRQTKEELRRFMMGGSNSAAFDDTPFYMRILQVFEDRRKLREHYGAQRDTLRKDIADLEAKPKDSSFDSQIKELKRELATVLDVIRSIDNEDVYGLLSRESLLPNYAFPEDGVSLRTIVRRKDEEGDGDEAHWVRTTHEYSRAAASAITDFAPGNTFYADGRHYTVDQIDLATSKEEEWRLCPNCSHAELVLPGTPVSTCPKCGSPGWADAGQLHRMRRLRAVVSDVDDQDSRTDDSSDHRVRAFFSSQLLVDIDKKDVASAYYVSNQTTGLDFGFEYARKATLREVNFGRSREGVGRETQIAGRGAIRPGFRYCTKCGKVEREVRGKMVIEHSYACPVRRQEAHEEDVSSDGLFIYREFVSEALRVLIPETSVVSDDESIQETFIATVMLGLHKKFGNVDHLMATISDEPVSKDSGYRKRYLVLYDSVPGGTGYLKQLNGSKAFMEVLALAKEALESCSCNQDPEKDGCYHCLFAFRTTRTPGSLSRTRAVKILDAILSDDNEVNKVPTVADIQPNNLLESALEQQFVRALGTIVGPDGAKAKVVQELVNDKTGYMLTVGNVVWEVEPQVPLGPADGVSVSCRPDFVFWPQVRHGQESPWKPVAVFTDGFEFHKGEVADDSLKREAIRRNGRFRVWGLSYTDVEDAFDHSAGSYYLDCLSVMGLPNTGVYDKVLGPQRADSLTPGKLSPFGMFSWYLTHRDAEGAFTSQAAAYAMAMQKVTNDRVTFDADNALVGKVSDALYSEKSPLGFGESLLNRWIPSESDFLAIYAGATYKDVKARRVSLVYPVLDDSKPEAKGFKHDWNGFLDLFNLMQFSGAFHAVTKLGLESGVYSALAAVTIPGGTAAATGASDAQATGDSPWHDIVDELFDEVSKEFATRLSLLGIPLPDEPGYELDDAMAELAWPAHRVCYLTQEQEEDRAFFEGRGWKIIAPNQDDVAIKKAFE